MTSSVEVTWPLDGITMSGTLTLPDGDGPFPAVVLVAGSGPTDRDWCSPLLPGTNGSGRLFAEAFAEAGIASLRYDKRASGPDAAESARALYGKLSMRSHLEELVAAVSVLTGHDAIDSMRLAGLGNSEGTLHVLHYVTSQPDVPFAGVVLAAPPGRSVGEVLLTQLAQQAAQLPGGTELMPEVEAAAARYERGEPMDLDPRLPDSVKMVLASFESPANLPLARELWVESAADELPNVDIPTLILIGRRDLQVDATADGIPLEQAAAGKDDITFAYPANANHVFKEDTRTPAEQAAAPGDGYNEDGTHLDPEALSAVLDWLESSPSRIAGDCVFVPFCPFDPAYWGTLLRRADHCYLRHSYELAVVGPAQLLAGRTLVALPQGLLYRAKQVSDLIGGPRGSRPPPKSVFRLGGVMPDQGVAEQVAVFGSTSATDTGAAILVSGVSDGASAS